MSGYPRTVRCLRVKYVTWNAPAAETIDDDYVCVECGDIVVGTRD